MNFTPGDQVMLKSGGPIMTYGGPGATIATNGVCYWFAGDTNQWAEFPLATLKLVEAGAVPTG